MAEQVQRRLHLDRAGDDADQLVGGRELLVEPPCALDIPGAEQGDHLLHLRPDDVRVHADPADPAELDEGEHEVVVPRVEVEPELDDASRLVEVVVRLLDRGDVRDLGQHGHRLRLDVDHAAAGDVVGDDREIGGTGNGLEVLDDRSLGRLVVVRRDDERRMRAGLLRLPGELDRVRGRVRARAGDHAGAIADRLEGCADEGNALVLAEGRGLAGRAVDDDAVGAVVHEERAQLLVAVEVDAAVRVERRHGRGQHLAEHPGDCTPSPPQALPRPPLTP